MEKLIRDGKVAVLYSPGFGAGWFTWNTYAPECLFDPEIVKIVLGEERGNIEEIAESKWATNDNYFYAGGWRDLEVEWLDEGSEFVIDEYDGSESIKTRASTCLAY